ncbi:urocortin-3 isoform X2 [Manacus candei]|uniref:urocortin-3 isoform X2 n=1 Tax=Manacus candei TaxID=415023 RepID=UPI00222661E7|nr:urocortin-3 isoform X2 [Manacus candei]XP_051626651.1 urocortin-3 isoform X2 [Manacus candei]
MRDGSVPHIPRESHIPGCLPRSRMSQPRLLLLLTLLCARPSRALGPYDAASSLLSCLHSALAQIQEDTPQENSVLDKRGSGFDLLPPAREASEERERERERERGGDAEEELGKRTFPGEGRYKAAARGQAKGKAAPKNRAKVTLSLDVPTNIMNILFDIAKAKNLRAKAAANAHLMAQIGRRK